MNPEIKKDWVEALRSGDYPQGRMALCSDAGFCCLGVLCDLAFKVGVVDKELFDSPEHLAMYDGEIVALPASVVRWAGLDSRNPEVRWAGKIQSLAGVNDDEYPFTLIADLIEEQL